jgi:hypothetical protein
VIEGGVGPDGCIMTDLAGRGETCRGMRRIVRAGVILLMARVAQHAVQGIVVVDVAIAALPRWHGVVAGQGEAGAVVVERRIQPGRCAVA